MGTGSAASRGFTLVEMMATVAVAGIVMTTAVPAMGSWVEQQRLKGAASELASDLQYARSEAVLRNEGVRVTFQRDRNVAACYIVHTGAADRCQCDSTGAGRCDSGEPPIKTVSIASAPGVSLQSNVGSVLFAPEHGTASPAASLRVTGSQATLQHTVNIMGRVRSCASQGQVSGYRPC